MARAPMGLRAFLREHMPIEPKSGEERDEYMERCVSTEVDAGMPQEQALAVCAQQWESRLDSHAVFRVDLAEDAPRMTRTEEGYLTGMARVARIGVQTYQNGDGSLRRELRRPEDVFARSALDSFRMTPITYGHPAEGAVDADNAKRLQVGFVGENLQVDGDWVVMPLTITDGPTIEQIESGEAVQLSGGYRTDVEPADGEWDGVQYDAVQRNIRGNHVAIVPRARAGEMARINLDAADAVAVTDAQTEETHMSEKTTAVNLDGITYDAAPEVANELERQRSRADAAEQGAADVRAEAETAKARADEAEAELARLKEERSDEAIREAARARVELERSASELVGDDADLSAMSDREVMESAIKAVHADAELADAEDVYVKARFDAAIATHKAHGDAMAQQREATTAPASHNDAEDPRKKAMDSVRDAYKRRDKGKYTPQRGQ